MTPIETEYARMKAAFWAIWPVVMEGLEPDLIHNRPEEFWGHARKLRDLLDELIDPDSEVVACVDMAIPVAHEAPGGLSGGQAVTGSPHRSPGRVESVRASGKCENCAHWQVGGPGMFACQNARSVHWMKNTGAAWTCDKFAMPRRPR